MKNKVSIFWFRRDLRLEDNTGLSAALAAGFPVLPVFIFDKDILDRLEDKYDRRVHYIHQALEAMSAQLRKHGAAIETFHTKPLEAFEMLLEAYDVQAVYCNRDYDPKAIKRDAAVADFLSEKSVSFFDFKDQVIFERSEMVKGDLTPYTIYTPYAKKWRSALAAHHLEEQTIVFDNFCTVKSSYFPSLSSIGFLETDFKFEAPQLDIDIIKDYGQHRDYPALEATTQLGTALRFGTISIRRCVAFALQHNDVWLSELIWREFFMQILFHFPKVVTHAFKAKYDFVEWRNNEAEFQLWCSGETGYPIVDAGMKQLNQTGFMHNRVRMIVASFLCKHLLIDWRWGEAYFAQKLNDYDLAANNGNWQWAAGCGCDAAPYFRIFNPTTQTQKFDKDLEYIRRWNPGYEQRLELPVVAHEVARERALRVYKKAVQETR